MSYKATVYTHLDEGVRCVMVDNYTVGAYYTFQDSTIAGDTTGNLTGDTIFTADIEPGYKFKQWVYRLVSTSGTVQHNTANPFVYDLGLDVYIRAETEVDSGGGSTTSEWTNPQGKTMDNIDTKQSQSIYLGPRNLYSFTIRTKYSGTLKAYTTGSLDTVGYLTTGLLWDDEEGVPYNIKAEGDDGSDINFELTYEVTAGTTYHLWVRCYKPLDEGNVTVVVEPPGAPQEGESGKAYVYIDGEGWVQVTPHIYSEGWKACTPNLFSNGDWEQGT